MVSCCLLVASCGVQTASGTPEHSRSSTGVNAATTPEGATAFRIGTGQWPGDISTNPYNPNVTPYLNFALLGLAYLPYVPRPGPNPYYPELASSWTATKSAILLHLRPDARWQNGTPVTSADIADSLLLAGADYNTAWASISSVVPMGPRTVEIRIKPHAVATNVLTSVLQMDILPKTQYGKLLPSGFQADLVRYWRLYNPLDPTTATINAAATSSPGKVIARVDKSLTSFSPSTFVGDGPYKLVRSSPAGLLYEKWNGWWDAKAIRMPWVEVEPMNVATQYGSLLSGKIDFEGGTYFTDPQVTVFTKHDGHYFVIPEPVQEFSLLFHVKDYPFNLLAVRQAIAYLVDRTKLQRLLLSGSLLQNHPPTPPDGISYTIGERYLSAKQLASLHAYRYNPGKAESLLKAAGFKKQAGAWYTPQGKPWSITIYGSSVGGIFSEAPIIIAKMLSATGIKATVDLVSSTVYTADQEAGDYAVSVNNVDSGFANPITYFAATFVGSQNYPVTYSGTGTCSGCHEGIGIGPVSLVPGLGKVNIAAALNREELSAPPSTWSQYVWDWARWINSNLPFIPLQDTDDHVVFSTNRYRDFPPKSHAWLWASSIGASDFVVQMQQGYIRLGSK